MTIQTTSIWLNDLRPDRRRRHHARRAVLHAQRDRLMVDQTAHLDAQQPMPVRGIHYEVWHPANKPPN